MVPKWSSHRTTQAGPTHLVTSIYDFRAQNQWTASCNKVLWVFSVFYGVIWVEIERLVKRCLAWACISSTSTSIGSNDWFRVCNSKHQLMAGNISIMCKTKFTVRYIAKSLLPWQKKKWEKTKNQTSLSPDANDTYNLGLGNACFIQKD